MPRDRDILEATVDIALGVIVIAALRVRPAFGFASPVRIEK